MNSAITIRSLLHEAETRLHGLATARLDAEVLLCHVAGLDRSRLYSAPEQEITPQLAGQFMRQLRERHSGRPVAYLTGTREFWSLEFHVNQSTLIPRPETECLVETVLDLIPVDKEYSVLDLGTGSGVIAIAAAGERPLSRFVATDTCDHALAVAQINARRHGMHNIVFHKSDWYSGLPGQYHVIVSNPPYIREQDPHLLDDGVRHEPRLALCGGPDGLEAIRKIISGAPVYLHPGGWLCLEHGYDQAAAVCGLFEQWHFTRITTRRDYSGLERVTYGQYHDE